MEHVTGRKEASSERIGDEHQNPNWVRPKLGLRGSDVCIHKIVTITSHEKLIPAFDAISHDEQTSSLDFELILHRSFRILIF
jgi:hypothetical protein